MSDSTSLTCVSATVYVYDNIKLISCLCEC